jgi:NAD(P)H-flavin reductase
MPALADRARPADWSEPARWRVAATALEAPGVVTLALTPPAAAPFSFRPGQFNMLYATGVGEVPVSISGDPTSPGPVRHTVREVGPVTRALCALRPGDQAGVRGPYGRAWPLRAAEGGDLLVAAGGIGLPPLRPALYQALARRDRYRRIIVLYGARTPADLLFTGELAAWRRRPGTEVEVTVGAGTPDWPGAVGVVPDLVSRARFSPSAATAFIVGPEIMMRFTARALLAAGVSPGRIFLSLERNLQCAVAMCGHCQLGPFLVCRDGPVICYDQAEPWLRIREA